MESLAYYRTLCAMPMIQVQALAKLHDEYYEEAKYGNMNSNTEFEFANDVLCKLAACHNFAYTEDNNTDLGDLDTRANIEDLINSWIYEFKFAY